MSISPFSRRQLPVYSPLSFDAVVGGLGAGIRGGESARKAVRDALTERYSPVDLLLTDSGTSALALALRAVREWRGDLPVALPDYSCFDVATAAVGADAPFLLYDIDPRSLAPDLNSLEETLEGDVAALVVAHLYGVPVDLDPVLDVARTTSTPVIEDAAQGAGGRYSGRRLGTFGSYSVLSFGRGKGVTGCGGGALLAHGSESARWLRRIRDTVESDESHGWPRVPGLVGQWLFGRPSLYWLPALLPFLDLGETVYRDPEPVRPMSAVSAGTLRRTLDLQEEEIEDRLRTAAWYRELIGEADGLTAIEIPSRGEPGYLRFPLLADRGVTPRLASDAAESLGIMQGYPRALGQLEEVSDRCRNLSSGRPGAAELATHLFTLPTHSRLTRADRRRIRRLIELTSRRPSSRRATASPAAS